jgi:hypothetical protein
MPDARLVGAWAPGSLPFDSAPDIGMPFEAGAGFLLQIHYHPGGVVNDPDATTIDLRLDSHPARYGFGFAGWGNAAAAPTLLPGPGDRNGVAEFRIPANAAAHTETMRFIAAAGTGDGPGRLFTVFPHMHYVGVDLHAKVLRAHPAPGEPAEECLVSIDRWDFAWQRTYQYDVPVADLPVVRAGDVIELTCTYDNTLANPYVERVLAEQGLSAPIDIALGVQSLDEMCLVLFGTVLEGEDG